MLPLLAMGLPVLAKAVGGALGLIDHPAARVAAEALGAVTSAIDNREISPEQLAEANRHAEAMARIEADVAGQELAADTDRLTEINRSMRAEAGSDDAYTRRWRPTWGYVTAATWALQSLALAGCVVAATWMAAKGHPGAAATLLDGATALAGALSVQWAIALSVLGVAVSARSKDKATAAGQAPAPGTVGALLGRIGGK